MKTRSLATTTAALAALACSALTLTACGPDDTSKTGSPAPASSAAVPGASGGGTSGTAGTSGMPSTGASPAGGTSGAPAPALVPADVPLCGNSEKESDVAAEFVGLEHAADPRWTAVVKLTNTVGHDCVMYGPADVETDYLPSGYGPLTTGVLGAGSFATDRAHGTLLHAGASVYQPVSWLSAPPVAPNAECTTGNVLAIKRNDGVLLITLPVKGARFCPVKETGSAKVLIGVPRTTLAEAKAQLQSAK